MTTRELAAATLETTNPSEALILAVRMLRGIAKGESWSTGAYWDALLRLEAIQGLDMLNHAIDTASDEETSQILGDAATRIRTSFQGLA